MDGKKKVYVISMGDWVKVGISADPGKRISGLSTACPLPPKLEFVFESKNPAIHERRIHSALAEWNTNGEWFAVSVDKAAETARQIIGGNLPPCLARVTSKRLRREWMPDPARFTLREATEICFEPNPKGITKDFCREKGLPWPLKKGWRNRMRSALIEHYGEELRKCRYRRD